MNKEKLNASLQNRTCIICNEKLGSYPYYLIKLNNIKGKKVIYARIVEMIKVEK